MRIRLVVECDHSYLGRILGSLPDAAQWHATQAPKPIAHSQPSVREATLAAYAPAARSLPAPKREGRRLIGDSNPNRLWIINYLRIHATQGKTVRWRDMRHASKMTNSAFSGHLQKLKHEGRITSIDGNYTWNETPTPAKGDKS